MYSRTPCLVAASCKGKVAVAYLAAAGPNTHNTSLWLQASCATNAPCASDCYCPTSTNMCQGGVCKVTGRLGLS